MSKRSRAQREIERMNRERLAQAQADPTKVDYPTGCSVEKQCHRPSVIAVITRAMSRQGVTHYQGWSACGIHVPSLFKAFAEMKEHFELAASGLKKISDTGLVAPTTPAIVPTGDVGVTPPAAVIVPA